MNSTSVCFFLFTLFLILISAKGSLIEDACKATSQTAGCLATLSSDPRIAAASDKKELAKLTLEMCVAKATEAQNVIKGLAASTNNPAIKQCATTHYDYVVESFKSCLGEIKVDPLTSNYDARVSGDGANDCDKAMSAAKVINPVISAKNKEMVMLSFVAYAVTNSL